MNMKFVFGGIAFLMFLLVVAGLHAARSPAGNSDPDGCTDYRSTGNHGNSHGSTDNPCIYNTWPD